MGNSQGIRIPKAFLESLGMKENDNVEIERVDDSIVIKNNNITKINSWWYFWWIYWKLSTKGIWLGKYIKCIDVISRDIHFIEKIPKDILDIDFNIYGNYDPILKNSIGFFIFWF